MGCVFFGVGLELSTKAKRLMRMISTHGERFGVLGSQAQADSESDKSKRKQERCALTTLGN
jgi:hypothetical protein